MWSTESLWFEIAIVSIIFATGNMLMGHFEERTPKIRRVAKYLLMLVLICGISVAFGRHPFYYSAHLYSRILFAKEKRNQWLDRGTEK